MIVWGYQKNPDCEEVKEIETKLEEQTMCLLLFFSVYESLAVMLASSRKSIAMTAKKPLLKLEMFYFSKRKSLSVLSPLSNSSYVFTEVREIRIN